MLPVCSIITTATAFPSNSQAFQAKYFIIQQRTTMMMMMMMGGTPHINGLSCKTKAIIIAPPGHSSAFTHSLSSSSSCSSSSTVVTMPPPPPYQYKLDSISFHLSDNSNYTPDTANYLHSTGNNSYLKFIDLATQSLTQDEVFTRSFNNPTPTSISEEKTLLLDNTLSSTVNADALSPFNDSFSASLHKGQDSLKDSLHTITATITSTLTSLNEAADNVIGKMTSSLDQTGEVATSKFTAVANNVREASGKAGAITVDALRHSIIVIEDSLAQGANYVVYAYEYAKSTLPPQTQNVLNSSEDTAVAIFRPVGTLLQQIYIALEVLERSVGLDPSDPIVPTALFLGTLATSWGFYWFFTYGGYAGDLSPKLTFELLSGKENVALIDARPEDLRERDGVPDLRRAARFRYANVILPEVDDSVKKLIWSGKDLEDSLTAVVIRNLKIVQDRSKVIVMDADGSRSKGIARSLRKLGVKRAYLVQGGFRSWASEGLRVKELKPETALTILNEEAEAILEEIKPTPLQVLGYSVALVAAAYATLDWEKTLQYIGVIGIAQTIYRRAASYESAEDFRKDVRVILSPVRLGGEAISWAAGKWETNGIGLPTSPSSSDVQNRVLQAAAKHESQPSDGEQENRALSTDSTVDLSEA
ncbi:calcium sensing receptor, chloroplastic isoform X2 [Impatiens glandulifera]|uniref:calcium sensing receptor, chloroplastic isoform X2 n=1 Tax=Impatiens glandulifera TaxID=253017 RepID=UPI001FB11D61|nr:calcium sensing receptor, chloroplastic isoform X2 [Impatiens glandulifera]